LKAREDLSSLSVVINREKDSAIRITAELDNLNEKLITLNPQANTGEYNLLVKKFNALQASVKSHANKITILFAEKDKKGKTIFNYLNSQALFRSKFEKDSYSQLDLTDHEKKFLAVIDSRVSLLSKDFSRHSVDYDDFSNSIEIDALLNGTVKAKFIVDTGASIVLLPKSLAKILDLKPVKTSSEIVVTLADGKKVKAYLVVLETIAIGDITAKNVEAAVLESGDDQTIGLLGMSFLKNFLVKIDSQNKKMILEEFEPVESRL
ncbi:MAG: retropepsin-like aspartic protease, partial [Candidatus Omnitrophica bacterium]|nr:retropepsin-like aspartic protease [Candidatus Omnitrophota bacterium]